MTFRSNLDAALARNDVLAARVAELEAELSSRPGGPAPEPSRAKPLLLLVGATFVAYVVAIGLWDGQPVNREAEHAFARFVAFAPFVASARLWPGRAAFGAASGVRLAWLAYAWFAFPSRFGPEFALFWYGGLGSVALLAAELFLSPTPSPARHVSAATRSRT